MSPKRGENTATSILAAELPEMTSSTYALLASGNAMIESESPETAARASNAPPVRDCLNVEMLVMTGIYAYPNAPEALPWRIPFDHASIRASFAAGEPEGMD